MSIESRKLDLIERLMRVRKAEVLQYYEELLIKAELLARNEESIEDMEKGNTVSLSEFRKSNKAWLNSNTK